MASEASKSIKLSAHGLKTAETGLGFLFCTGDEILGWVLCFAQLHHAAHRPERRAYQRGRRHGGRAWSRGYFRVEPRRPAARRRPRLCRICI